MDSGIPAWIHLPYIPLPAIRLPSQNLLAHSLVRDSPACLSPNSTSDRFALVQTHGTADASGPCKTV
jgi:hypothetical protein